MELIQTPDKKFVDGDRRTPGTPVPAWWLNQLQDELAAVVSDANIQLDQSDKEQVIKAVKKIAKREGKGVLDNAPLVIYATSRADFIARKDTPEIQALPDGAVAVAQGYFYERKKNSKYIPDLPGWVPVNESFGHFDGSYSETARTNLTTKYVKDDITYNVTLVQNIKPNTFQKQYHGGIQSDMTASLVTLREVARAKKYPCILLNTDLFLATSDLSAKKTKVQGLQILDGQLVKNFAPGDDRDALIMTRQGWLESVKKSDNLTDDQINAKGVVWSAYFGPTLIKDGVIQTGLDKSTLSSRNAIGQKANRDIVIIQVEGVTDSSGCTIHRVAELLKAEGCIFGFNLDGGGSTQMWWRDCYSFLSSDNDYASERLVGGFLEITADDVGEFDTGWQSVATVEGIKSADSDVNMPAVCYRQKGAEIQLRISVSGNFTAGFSGVFTSERIPKRFTSINFREMRGSLVGADLTQGMWYAGSFLSLRAIEKSPYFTGIFKWFPRNYALH